MDLCCRCGKIAPIKTSTCSIDCPVTKINNKTTRIINCDKIIKWVDKDEETTTTKCAESELPDEIWVVHIMGKLPIKSLYICKCVSKTWHSRASYIIDTYKGIQLPPHGLLCDIVIIDSTTRNHYLGYLCFGDGSTKRVFRDTDNEMSMDDDDDRDRCTIKVEDDYGGRIGVTLLSEKLTLDLTSLVSDTRKRYFWTMHRGLVLTFRSTTYHVYNPTTRQGFVLPTAPSHMEQLQNSKPLAHRQATIINLSDCLLSSQSNFRVVKFAREPHRVLIEVYCSNKHQWFQSEVHIDRAASTARWYLGGTVYLDNTNTLFFMTRKRHLVAVKFVSSDFEQVTVYSLRLPRHITKGFAESTLHGSQGCLYLFYNTSSKVRIWKHNNGISVDPDAWTPQLIFCPSGMCLCQPVTEKFLRQSVADGIIPNPMTIHPEAPLVFFYARPSIFAIHLLNDTVEKIAELTEGETFSKHYSYMYSPCFSSFKCPKPVNQTCDDRHLRIKRETNEINV